MLNERERVQEYNYVTHNRMVGGCAVSSTTASVATTTGSALGGLGGCNTRFPSRGGVDLVMNSIMVGSLSAAWRSAGKGLGWFLGYHLISLLTYHLSQALLL